MEQISTMEKKNQPRAFSISSKVNQDAKSIDISFKKNGSQYPRKRDSDKLDTNKKPLYNRGGRSGQRYVRPREKVDCQVEPHDSQSELGSLQRSGGKKQNISHLLNWWGPAPYERFSNRGSSTRGYTGAYSSKKHSVQHAKYNKEHYLQANCQFVVSVGNDYSTYEKNPDQLVEWDYVQEVRLHMSEPPSCPICLFSPVAAKVTRCGHIYCYSCILHYLALSDKKWRKCPICFDAITKEDLKSVTAILHKDRGCGDEIEFQLMRRERDSLIPIPVSQFSTSMVTQKALLSDPSSISSLSKLIIATPEEVIRYIVLRELEALKNQFMEEGNEPESCFIEAAIELVTLRLSSLSFESTPSPQKSIDTADGTVITECTQLLDHEDQPLIREREVPDINSNDQEFNKCFQKMNLKDCQSLNSDKCLTVEDQLLDPEDLDICHLQSHASKNQLDVKGPKSTYYFYQESSGANIFLHALNVHMLVKEYGNLENCPHKIKAKVLEKESASMTEGLRQRLRYLRHLPITCPFEVAEIEMKFPLVSQLTIAEFQGQLENRLKKRRKKAKEEHRIEKRVQVEEDKMMGRCRGSQINMTSYKHFPTFTEDPPAIPEDDLNASLISVGSPQSDSAEFPAMSTPSFAQMINRPGNIKENRGNISAFPSLTTSEQANKIQQIKKVTAAWHVESEDDDEEAEKVPNFRLAFSNAFDKALDEAKKVSYANEANGNSQRGKKGKKKKAIVLLSSGGHR